MEEGEQTGPTSGGGAGSEQIARFILMSGWLHKGDPTNVRVRPNAFLPHPLRSAAVSVYRISGWSEEAIQEKGAEVADERENNHRRLILAKGEPYPAEKRSFTHHGWAQLGVAAVRSVGLDVVPAEPPVRHANIVGWPAPKEVCRKVDEAAQLEFALRLAHVCVFVPAA